MVKFRAQWGIRAKLCVALLFIMVLPGLVILVLVEPQTKQDYDTCLAVLLALAVSLVFPLAHLLARFVIVAELDKINKFCLQVRKGKRGIFFDLPLQADEENEILTLKRNLNWMLYAVSSREKSLYTYLAETKKDKNRFQKLSTLDPLTQLYNRRYFDSRLHRAIEESLSDGSGFCLVLMDLDRFKQVNDSFGHQVGDQLLVSLATNIKDSTRKAGDVAFRYGGDEFGVLVFSEDPDGVVKAMKRILVRHAVYMVGDSTLSMGMAYFNRQDKADGDVNDLCRDLFEQADQAVYQAKKKGGGQIVYEKSMKRRGRNNPPDLTLFVGKG
ncbi:GGDEF domain-containing protein [Dethiosulfatarculus sandiegensis]|uniref:diguanylate cyclase n=1 Tax=Dethiosulfatarculus sandiegensis TaxID=1429043 RepID=A0A0D2JDB7_9BACT|nr:GGDEF domain-containing protein [Dethiosulfatarculus sandiegensis]KIX13721.1 diguanylate cyclase [Dethiosulfatarculus sandiegensis]